MFARKVRVEPVSLPDQGIPLAQVLSQLGLDTSSPPPNWRGFKGPYAPGRLVPGVTLQGDPARFSVDELMGLQGALDRICGPASDVRAAFRRRGWAAWGGALLSRLPGDGPSDDLWLVRLPLGETSIHRSAPDAIGVIDAEITRLDAVRAGGAVIVDGLGPALVVDDGADRLARVRVAPGDVRFLPRLARLDSVVIDGVTRFLLEFGGTQERFADCGQPEPLAGPPALSIRVSPDGWSGGDGLDGVVVSVSAVVGPADPMPYPRPNDRSCDRRP